MVAAMSKAEDTADGMSKVGIGQPVLRFEDRHLLTGEGRFIDDVNLPGGLRRYSARAVPGVLADYTGADVVVDGLGTTAPNVLRKRPYGTPMFVRSHPGLSRRLSANLATPLAMVLAETCARASDAAELIVVEYNERPSITDTVQSTKDKSPCGRHVLAISPIFSKRVIDRRLRPHSPVPQGLSDDAI